MQTAHLQVRYGVFCVATHFTLWCDVQTAGVTRTLTGGWISNHLAHLTDASSNSRADCQSRRRIERKA